MKTQVGRQTWTVMFMRRGNRPRQVVIVKSSSLHKSQSQINWGTINDWNNVIFSLPKERKMKGENKKKRQVVWSYI